jgi:excisionase family DNA binding protein
MADDKVAYTVEEAARLIGYSRSAMYQAIKEGVITSVRVSKRRTVITRAELLRWLDKAQAHRAR